MEVEIRTLRPDELDANIRAIETAFGEEASPDVVEHIRPLVEVERSFVAVDGSEIVGGTSSNPFELTVPGALVPAAGVTAVGVIATHRRRGINTALMRRQLDDAHAREEPLAVLYASQGGIYGRFGYGLGSFLTEIDVETSATAFVRGYRPAGRVRLVERAEALKAFPAVYDEIRPAVPGFIARNELWWEDRFWDHESRRDGAGPYFFAVHETDDGVVDAYVAYRVKHDWQQDAPRSQLRVTELLATTAQGYADMWRYCFDVDLIHRVTAWNRPVDDALLHLVADPNRLRMRVIDGLWVRLVDVPAALAARRYSAEGVLVAEIHDPFCPWNERRYRLEGGPDGASCRPATSEPDLRMTVNDLGAAYLGGSSFRQLHRAGRVLEERPGALARADAMFAWDPAPWCSQMF